jgi:cytochrome c biogenesis protein CcdA
VLGNRMANQLYVREKIHNFAGIFMLLSSVALMIGVLVGFIGLTLRVDSQTFALIKMACLVLAGLFVASFLVRRISQGH